MNKRNRTTRRRSMGFSMIEVTVASIILALAVLSIVAAQQAFHQQNDVSQETSLGLSLANELREVTLAMPPHDPISGSLFYGPEANETDADEHVMVTYLDDLDDFANTDGGGFSFSPPINALREAYPNMDNWTQTINVENVDPDDVSGPAVTPGSTEVLRMTVQVLYDDPDGVEDPRVVSELSWISVGLPK